MMLLAGDLGGTKTNLAIVSVEGGLRAPLAAASLPSAEYPNLETLVRVFLDRVNLPVERACFGVAGPVASGRATVTNLPWLLDESALRAALHLSSVRLLNDLDAIAHAVPILEPADLHTLNRGDPNPNGALAVIAPGTGLGESFLVWDGSAYRAHASEGGHADFAPTSQRQLELLRYLRDRFTHVSYERVCSGIGLPNIYAFLKDSRYAEEPSWLARQLAAAVDPTPVIVNAALNGAPPHTPSGTPEHVRPPALCVETLNLFVSILGAEAGNLALKVLATGGVYIGGGIPPRILSIIASAGFMRAFQHKGRFADMLGRVPVHVILNPNAGLLGAARRGLEDDHA